MLLRDFAEDPEKCSYGSPCYFDVSHGTITFIVGRLGTDEARKQISVITKSIYGPVNNYSEIDHRLIYAHWLAEHGVVSWENIDEENTEYSKVLARDIFLAKEHMGLNGLNDMLISHASSYENYLFDEAMEELENIKKS